MDTSRNVLHWWCTPATTKVVLTSVVSQVNAHVDDIDFILEGLPQYARD